MAIRDVFKISRKTFFYPTAWLGYSALRNQTTMLWGLVKNLFTISKPAQEETFEESMQRQHLSETDLHLTLKYYRSYTYLFIAIGISILIFGFYLLFQHSTIHGWILAIATGLLCFAQAFKYDFWAFQITQRKLGCTLQEWKKYRWHRTP